jgi:hypothetical protein
MSKSGASRGGAASAPHQRSRQQQDREAPVAHLEAAVFKIAAKLDALSRLARTLNLPKELADKYHQQDGSRNRGRRVKNSELDSGRVVLDQVNDLVAALAELRAIEGADMNIIVPQGVVDAINEGRDPNAFLVSELNARQHQERFLQSQGERIEEFAATLLDRLAAEDDDPAPAPAEAADATAPAAAGGEGGAAR